MCGIPIQGSVHCKLFYFNRFETTEKAKPIEFQDPLSLLPGKFIIVQGETETVELTENS